MVVEKGRHYDELEALLPAARLKKQEESLHETIAHMYTLSSFLKNQMDSAAVRPFEIKSVKDLEKIPIVRKDDIIEAQKNHPPFGGLLAVPPAEIERIFISPGPIYEFQPSDIRWFARSFYAAGFRKGDIVINTFTYHMSPAGMMFHEGIRHCGATVVVMGTGNTETLIKTMLDLKVTGFAGTPSFLMAVIKKAEEMGYDFTRDFALKKTWFTGEMLPPSIRRTLEQEYKLTTSQAYAVTEPGGAIAYECPEKNGMHIMDEYILEIVDPQTGLQLKPGEVGEIVVTPVHNRTWGLVRFGTGDLSSLVTVPCPCGRTSYRLSGLLGRSADAVKVRGMFIVAKQADQALSELSDISVFQILVDRQGNRDSMILNIELKEATCNRSVLFEQIHEKFQKACRLKLDDIQVVAAGSISADRKVIQDVRKWD